MAFTFEPVGRCIYCGKENIPLSDEHIIPFGLGGQFILPESSCKECAAITGKFEGVVQRTIYGDFRMRNRLPTRRKNERPKLRTINTIGPDGKHAPKEVPVDEFPAPYWVYTFGNCGILLGSQPDIDVAQSFWNMKTIHNHEELVAFEKKYGWDNTAKMKFMPYEFMRMIAKAGYSYAVGMMGFGSFKPTVAHAILNPKANISYFVGMNEIYEPMVQNEMHQLKIVTKVAPARTTLISVEVRLFASVGTPTYHVIVGEFENRAQEFITLKKLQEREHVEFSVPRI